MGKGSKTTRNMNVLITRILRKRQLKKGAAKTFARPDNIGPAPKISDSNSEA